MPLLSCFSPGSTLCPTGRCGGTATARAAWARQVPGLRARGAASLGLGQGGLGCPIGLGQGGLWGWGVLQGCARGVWGDLWGWGVLQDWPRVGL